MTWNNLKRIAKTRRGWYLNYNISGKKDWPLKTSHFIVARHWNSDTPIIPRRALNNINYSEDFGAIGGGYFLRHHNIGIAIDPGHAFLKSLYEKHDITATDIDIIIITHFHQDHCSDIANYLTLSRVHEYRPVIFAPIPVLQYLKLLDTADLNSVSPGMSISIYHSNFEILTIKFLPALHWQTITPSSLHQSRYHTFIDYHMSSIGLRIELRQPNQNRPKLNKIVITGDTFFPVLDGNDFTNQCYDLYLGNNRNYINLNNVNHIIRPTFEAILRLYFANFLFAYFDMEADLVCYHIGSVEDQFADMTTTLPLNTQYNGHHLGVLGVLRLMQLMKLETQKLAIITEWGEELRGERKNISKLIEQRANRMNSVNNVAANQLKSIPSDIDLMIDLQNGLIKCSEHSSFHDYNQMAAQELNSEYIQYKSVIKNPELNNYENTCDWD